MPTGKLAKGRPTTTLVFDAFVRLPARSTLVAAWPTVTLDPDAFTLAAHLAQAIGYLGRAESWTECEAIAEWDGQLNCRPSDGSMDGDSVRVLAPRSPKAYAAERRRIIDDMTRQMLAGASGSVPTERAIRERIDRSLRTKGSRADTLPERLVDALSLDTSDYQECGWSRPPAAHEVVYTRSPKAALNVVAPDGSRRPRTHVAHDLPKVARFLLAGRPLPRIEDAIKIGELMRRAALAQFGWQRDKARDRWIPKAPWQISGRHADGQPLKHPSHLHAFWLPEDADGDGWIDHISVFVSGGIDRKVQAGLDRITRIWLGPDQRADSAGTESGSASEWRLALEGFGQPADFSSGARIFRASRCWRSVTPFLASGHLKASGYPGELNRLLARREVAAANVEVRELAAIDVGGAPRRAVHFQRFRSRGREAQPDANGAFLSLIFPAVLQGPLAIGYASHFGLGLFAPVTTAECLVEAEPPLDGIET